MADDVRDIEGQADEVAANTVGPTGDDAARDAADAADDVTRPRADGERTAAEESETSSPEDAGQDQQGSPADDGEVPAEPGAAGPAAPAPDAPGPEQDAPGPEQDAPGPEQDAPTAPSDAMGVVRGFARHARGAADAGVRSVASGYSAIREVSRARRAHADAREKLEELEAAIASSEQELEHRREVERDYDAIIELQTKELGDAGGELAEATDALSELAATRDGLVGKLKELKADNEQRLRPYRDLMEAAKGALDDARGAHGEAKRALRTAQGQLDTASNARDTRLASANRAVDGASARLQRLQDQLAQMKRDPSTGAKELTEMSGGVAAALAQLENARADLTRVTAETRQAVEIAQTHLYTQKISFEDAEHDLEAARADAQEKADGYEELKAEADATEQQLDSQIQDATHDIAEQTERSQRAQGRIDAAQALIDEANEIHAHPEATEQLAHKVSDDRSAAEVQRRQVEALAEEERSVRATTLHTRIAFVAAAAIAAVVAAVIMWAVSGLLS